jgi:hypothetical protein
MYISYTSTTSLVKKYLITMFVWMKSEPNWKFTEEMRWLIIEFDQTKVSNLKFINMHTSEHFKGFVFSWVELRVTRIYLVM